MAFTISLPEKSFKVDITDFDEWLKANAPAGTYLGLRSTSNDKTNVVNASAHFNQTLTQQQQTAVLNRWNNLTQSNEDLKLRRKRKFRRLIRDVKLKAVSQGFEVLAQSERKVLLSVPLTQADKQELISIYGDA